MKATSLEDLKKASLNRVIELPPFPNGAPLVVEIKSPSIMTMMADGRISNPLLASVSTVIDGEPKAGADDKKKPVPTAKQKKSAFELIKAVAKECLVKPTYEEIESTVGGLTDTQMLALFTEVRGEVEGLSTFPQKSSNSEHSVNE